MGTEGGCLFCGIGHQVLPAKAVEQLGRRSSPARQIWTMWKITPEQMGGPSSPTTLAGRLCRPCSAAVTQTGAVGATAMERALTTAICPDLVGKLPCGSVALPGLKSWAVIRFQNSDTPPSEKPFAHLPDIEALPSQLRSALGG
jgi:hypothetical protein